MYRILSFTLIAALLIILSPSARAESIVESQQRQLVTLRQKLVEMRARLKDGAPELTELEGLVHAHEKFVVELRENTKNTLTERLDEIEKQLDFLRNGKVKADPVREALLEQARSTILRRLLENQLGFELDKEVAGLPASTTDAAAGEAVRTGAISFRLPDNADNNVVEQLKKQIARIAPNVELNYVEQMKVMTASGGDAVQIRRVQNLATAIREAGLNQRWSNNNNFGGQMGGMGGGDRGMQPQRRGGGGEGGPGFGGGGAAGGFPQGDGMRPPRPPGPPGAGDEQPKPKEPTTDKF